MWLGGLEAVTDSLCGSESLILAGAYLVEASLLAAKPAICFGQFVQAIVHHPLHCTQDLKLTDR